MRRSSGVSEGISRSSGTVATASSMADHSTSGSVTLTASACWASTCSSVKQDSSAVVSFQKVRTRSARSSRPSNISARFGYRACIEGRAATWRSQERSETKDADALTGFALDPVVSSVNIGIWLY